MNLASSAGINDIPLVAEPKGEGIITDIPINYWLMPKNNRLTIKLFQPSEKPSDSGEAKVEAMIYIADPNSEFPKPGEVLAKFEWPGKGEPGTYPYILDMPFDITGPIYTSLWREAGRIESVTDEDKISILNLAEKLRRALLNKEAEKAYSLLEYRYTDEAWAENKDPERIRSVVIGQYHWMFGFGDLTADPLTIGNSEFAIVGDNRLVHVRHKNYHPAITLKHEESGHFFGIPVYAARIKGKWIIAR